jgi:hypothetical protein
VAVVKEFLSVAKITQIRATVLPQACIYEGALDHDLGAGDAGQIGAVLFDHSRGQLFANAVMAASRAGGRIAVRRRAALAARRPVSRILSRCDQRQRHLQARRNRHRSTRLTGGSVRLV